jgi:hypothetical protein
VEPILIRASARTSICGRFRHDDKASLLGSRRWV